jgi:hypothetical protein
VWACGVDRGERRKRQREGERESDLVVNDASVCGLVTNKERRKYSYRSSCIKILCLKLFMGCLFVLKIFW